MNKAMRTALLLLLAMSGSAAAQVSDVEVPLIVIDVGGPDTSSQSDDSLDLANIVQSAAKGLTTVQEAPAIVTVVTSDDIREHQFQDILQLIDTVPGWMRNGMLHSMFPVPAVRGQVQAVQFLHDGVSLFDPMVNMATITRAQPMELIKRVEMITGPGGVLWGSNSLLGILNIITKDAEDIEGVEVGSSIGHGDGDRMAARAYVMAGKSDLMDGKLKLFGHGSVDSYQGARYEMPLLIFHNPLPQPNSPNTYGPLTASEQLRSMTVSLNGKLTYGKLKLRVSVPWGHQRRPLGLSGNPSVSELPEDARPECQGAMPAASCVDPRRTSRDNEFQSFDRYVVGEYQDRFANGKAGITFRGYAQQFRRGLFPLTVLAPTGTIQGGLSFETPMMSYRTGGNFDGDFEATKKLRVLYGAEAFREWLGDYSGDSIQGAGSSATFASPYDLTRLPLPCPRTYDDAGNIVPVANCPLTFTFQTSRSVMGAYVSPQLRPNKKIILDGGVRVQVAPEALGSLGYQPTLTAASTLVWNFIPNWHLKVNYAQGFRPPVFNNTSSNGEAVQIGGDPNLKVENSDAVQAEVNARIFKGDRRIRELSFRVDGSYTRITNFIQVNSGAYANSADRGISSAEFLGKLYIQGGHRLEMAYTWMRIATGDRGIIRSAPEHYFNFSSIFNLAANKLTGMMNLKVVGSAEDPNRLVEYRNASYDPMTGAPAGVFQVAASDVVFDKLPPVVDLSLGVTWTPIQKLLVRATVYNALMQHAYQSDLFFDYEPHLEYMPNPYEGIRGYVSAVYQY